MVRVTITYLKFIPLAGTAHNARMEVLRQIQYLFFKTYMYNVNIFIRTKYPSLVLSLKQKGSQCIWYKLRNFGNIKVRGILHMLETFGSCQFGQLVSTWVPTCVLVVVTDVKFKIYIVNVMLCIKRKVIVVSRLGRMNLT